MENRFKRFGDRLLGLRRRLRGVALVEVLVAATVMALGVAGITLTQPILSASSDAARLRAEATRLAQQKLDELRAFQRVPVSTDPAVITYRGTIVSSPEAPVSVLSNTTFYRGWVVNPLPVAEPDDEYKLVTVTVRWVGRDNVEERVRLTSTIARTDPAGLGNLAVGPVAATLRQPKGRNLDIPYDATLLVGGLSSAYQPFGASSPYFQFDNKSGLIQRVCVGNAAISGSTIAGDVCQDFSSGAYGLSGYVRFCPSSGGCVPAAPAGNAKHSLLATTATSAPLSFDSSNGLAPAYQACYSGRQVILDDGTVELDVNQDDKLIRLIGYFCVVQPQVKDGPWFGRVTLNPDTSTGWSVTAGGSHKVCRYSADYERTATLHAYCSGKNLELDEGQVCRMTNNEHPLWYRSVNANLLNQNYLVIAASESCPTGVAAQPLSGAGSYLNAGTVLHQTPVAGETPQRSFTCLSNCSTDSQPIEPATPSFLLKTE